MLKISGLISAKISNISEVHGPIPLKEMKCLVISSSVIESQSFARKFSDCEAIPKMYCDFGLVKPHFAIISGLNLQIFSGVIGPTTSDNRPQIESAARTEICCPTIERTRVEKISPWPTSDSPLYWETKGPMTSSFSRKVTADSHQVGTPVCI